MGIHCPMRVSIIDLTVSNVNERMLSFFSKHTNKPHCSSSSGFTLIELMVVIALISIMLMVATPNFSGFLFTDNTNKTARWIMVKVKLLKERAVCDQKDYVLNADLDSNFFWITDETMETDEDLLAAQKNGYELPEGVALVSIASSSRGEVSSGQTEVFFNKKGYSDQAVIMIEGEDDRKLYLTIESFLPAVKLFEE
jgi:prepilin-type N-terminal cleavage/methylation domain-containing protein